MKYYSLTDNNNIASFSEAVIRGLAPDRGLYFPESTPRLDENFLADIATKSMVEIGVEVMRPFVGGTIPEVRLEKIVRPYTMLNHQAYLPYPTPILGIHQMWPPRFAYHKRHD